MRKYLHYWLAIVLFAVYFVSYTDLLSHVLYYNEQHSLFLYTAEYFHHHSLTEYLTAFLVQFFHYPLMGSLVMASLLTAVYLMTWRVFTSLTQREDLLRLSFIPSLVLWVWSASLAHTLAPVVWTFVVLVVVWMLVLCFHRRGKTVKPSGLKGWKYAVVTSAVVVVIGGVTGYSFLRTFSISEFRMIKAQQAIDQHRWDDVLHHTSRYLDNRSQTNPLIFYFRNLALYNRNELLDHLFDYQPKMGTEALFFPWRSRTRETEFGHYLTEQLGCINDAQHWEFEAMVVWGETAPRLINLAKYCILNGRKTLARKYIARLRQSLFYSSEADRLEACVESGHIDGLRAFSTEEPEKADFVNVLNLAPNLEYVLQKDSQNRMVYEYLQCYLLLKGNLYGFVENLKDYRRFYAKMPRIFEEALVVFQLIDSDDSDWQVSSEVRRRFQRYLQLVTEGNKAALRAEFGNTYWYYVNYVRGERLKR